MCKPGCLFIRFIKAIVAAQHYRMSLSGINSHQKIVVIILAHKTMLGGKNGQVQIAKQSRLSV